MADYRIRIKPYLAIRDKRRVEEGIMKRQAVPVRALEDIVAGFRPAEIGLARAWEELYRACQAAGASPDLLRAVHDIKESIEDLEGKS